MDASSAHETQVVQVDGRPAAVCSCGWHGRPADYRVTAEHDGLWHWLEPEQEGTTVATTTNTLTREQLDALEERAYDLGADHGRAAASWYFDGNTTQETYKWALRGIRDGDPAVYDTFPSAPLSGEWADGPTPATLAADLDLDDDDDLMPDLCGMYEDGFGVAVADTIEREAIRQLEAEPAA